ncbi:hypothetical protein CEXT_786561 [Caerostris extrusa]|uniref:Uncharacterized protein n=1 Tax=Caerostris extrusa TaxID=172846 RepID=A0AAV4YE02_CAEEX|nr:hypothetical protein CEXT_786561 [Caerostris extrusa]
MQKPTKLIPLQPREKPAACGKTERRGHSINSFGEEPSKNDCTELHIFEGGSKTLQRYSEPLYGDSSGPLLLLMEDNAHQHRESLVSETEDITRTDCPVYHLT